MLGADDKKVMFLFTDAHVADEGFLELINNMLTSGMVPALYDDAEKDNLINRWVRLRVKGGPSVGLGTRCLEVTLYAKIYLVLLSDDDHTAGRPVAGGSHIPCHP
jgi:hypothetical protein